MDILKWVEGVLRERGIKNYGLTSDLVSIAPAATVEFDQQNNYYFLINAFGSLSLPVDGEIIGADEALPIKPHIMQTHCYKHQHFTGEVNIRNYNTTQTLYVEFLIASPTKA